jgi:hypothetical protein
VKPLFLFFPLSNFYPLSNRESLNSGIKLFERGTKGVSIENQSKTDGNEK